MNIPEIEKKILEFWQKNKIFEKSLKKGPTSAKATAGKKDFVFYDGPPFATGLPHYGHILGSVIKDVVPRYWTMKGYRVPRRWGWDCHGLPIETLVEKKLKVSGKKEIEDKIGVDKFNEACRQDVLMYTQEWKKMVDRIGRWIEFDNAYKTMDSTYMESVWWALKTIWGKGLIYEGRKVLMYCPRCETPISKAEVAMDNSYQDITEESIYVRFKVKSDDPEWKNTSILAWTTTIWTLPGNVALAINPKMEYVCIPDPDQKGHWLVLEKNSFKRLLEKKVFPENFNNLQSEQIDVFLGEEMLGIEYEPLFFGIINEKIKNFQNAFKVYAADFVTTDEGTGVVHTAVVYGEEDYNLGLEKNLPIVPLLDEKGYFNKQAPKLIQGQYFKDAEKDIIKYLRECGLIFKLESCTHSYPHCWRCDTQLFYNAISAWFVNIQKIKDKLIALNEKINWYPGNLKHGRFLNILETAPDWNISRNRYWATPLPFWKCNNKECDYVECVGSVKELKEKAINFKEVYSTDKIEKMDLHKHLIDKIKLKCEKCSSEMTRISEVVDCWVESASMPFAEHHYPFENEEIFKKRYPGQYIAEYIAQTRAWFYYMHVMGTLLFDDISFKNCVTTGTVLNEKGEKLSKSRRNFTDPWDIINQYGADSLRFYLMTSVVMQAENLFFSDQEVRDTYNKVISLLLNVLNFYKTFASNTKESATSKDVLDKWILSKLNLLIKEVTVQMDNYNVIKAGRPIKNFIEELSTWYVRRSRGRFKSKDKNDAVKTLKYVLLELSKAIAPFIPFTADYIYQEVGGPKESVHLENWPEVDKKLIDEKLEEQMDEVRNICSLALQARVENGIKVRQPLAKLQIIKPHAYRQAGKFQTELLDLIKAEVNIKEIVFGKTVELDTKITTELKEEGIVRDFVRSVQAQRKKEGLTPKNKIKVYYSENKEIVEKNKEQIKKQVIAKDIILKRGERIEIKKT